MTTGFDQSNPTWGPVRIGASGVVQLIGITRLGNMILHAIPLSKGSKVGALAGQTPRSKSDTIHPTVSVGGRQMTAVDIHVEL